MDKGGLMMKIAICDDEQSTCAAIDKMIDRYAMQEERPIKTKIFNNGEALCKELEQDRSYDLIFLDIELGKMTGIDVGKRIRDIMENDWLQIVYISSKRNYAMSLFKMRPLDFLLKPVKEKDVVEALDKCARLINSGNKVFEYKHKKITYKIEYKKILYFKSDDKKINIIMENEDKEFYGKLATIEKQLVREDFVLVHKSYLVNMKKVEEYKYDFVKMINGDIISISQANRKAIRERLLLERKEDNDGSF